MDFSLPYMYYTEEMLLKKASADSGQIDYLQFMNPFQNNVWFATLASIVVISVAVFFINYFSPYGYKDENGRGTSEEFSFFNSMWFTLACMLQQGADSQPRSLSGILMAHLMVHQFCILRRVRKFPIFVVVIPGVLVVVVVIVDFLARKGGLGVRTLPLFPHVIQVNAGKIGLSTFWGFNVHFISNQSNNQSINQSANQSFIIILSEQTANNCCVLKYLFN